MGSIQPPGYAGVVPTHEGIMLDLPNVTSIAVDDRTDARTTQRLAEITRWHRRFMRLGREVIVSGARPDVPGIDWVKLAKWPPAPGGFGMPYSIWYQNELPKHFSTPFVLTWQMDGFAINPRHWSDDFLKYDYLGAPFAHNTNEVGNGGFSMRSNKFCEEAAKLPKCHGDVEDCYFCGPKRGELVSQGIIFAPLEVARRWGVDWGNPAITNTFGFHGKSFIQRIVSRGRQVTKWP